MYREEEGVSVAIERQMDDLFGRPGDRKKPRSSDRDLTHQLAALARDIIAHWQEIDEKLKRRIKNEFRVDTSADPIKISLL